MKNKIFIALSCLALLVGGCKNNPIPSEQSELKDFSVTFDANGGEFSDGDRLKSITVKEGSTVRKEIEPHLEYYEFTYWGKNRDGLEFDFSTPITSDLTLFANWYQDPCTLFGCTLQDTTFENGFLTVELNGKNNDNFNLAQYLIISDGASAEVIDADTQEATSASSVHVEGYKTEYILRVNDRSRVNHRDYQLKIIQHYGVTLTLMVQDSVFNSCLYSTGETCLLSTLGTPDPIGYDFKGWSLTPDGENIVETVFMDDDKTVYAALEAKVYPISLDPDGGYIYTHPETYTMEVTYGEYYHLPIPTKPNYNFVAWTFKDSGTTLPIDSNGDSTSPWLYTFYDSYELIATYTPVDMIMTFVVDGDIACSVPAAYGFTIVLVDIFRPADTSDREFLYWQNSNGERVDTYLVTQAETFYAVFRNLSINVHCYDNDEPTTVVVRYGESFSLPTPFYVSQDGYLFTGYAYNGVQITDEFGNSLGVWNYSNDADVYVDILKEVFYYTVVYFVDGVRVHSEQFDARYATGDEPLWECDLTDNFHGWSSDRYFIDEGFCDVHTLRDCWPLSDSGGFSAVYGATCDDPYSTYTWYDTMGCYGVNPYPSDLDLKDVVVPNNFNGVHVGIIGSRYEQTDHIFPLATESVTFSEAIWEFDDAFQATPNLKAFYLTPDTYQFNSLKVSSDHKILYYFDSSDNTSRVVAVARDVTSFSIEGNVTGLQSYAFENCSQLTDIDIYPQYLNQYNVGRGTFYGCEGINFRFHGTESEFNERFSGDNLPNNYTVEYV